MPPPFPPHIPGRTPRPPEGAFNALKQGLGRPLTGGEIAAHPALRAGLELLADGYAWEAHEVLEALWMTAAPASRERSLLQALIQLANARLKTTMGRETAARRIALLGHAALRDARLGGAADVLGLSLAQIEAELMQYIA